MCHINKLSHIYSILLICNMGRPMRKQVFENSEGPYQPAHQRSLIRDFTVRYRAKARIIFCACAAYSECAFWLFFAWHSPSVWTVCNINRNIASPLQEQLEKDTPTKLRHSSFTKLNTMFYRLFRKMCRTISKPSVTLTYKIYWSGLSLKMFHVFGPNVAIWYRINLYLSLGIFRRRKSILQNADMFLIFPQKAGFDISCKLSPLETICMKCQNRLSGKKNKVVGWNFFQSAKR